MVANVPEKPRKMTGKHPMGLERVITDFFNKNYSCRKMRLESVYHERERGEKNRVEQQVSNSSEDQTR